MLRRKNDFREQRRTYVMSGELHVSHHVTENLLCDINAVSVANKVTRDSYGRMPEQRRQCSPQSLSQLPVPLCVGECEQNVNTAHCVIETFRR